MNPCHKINVLAPPSAPELEKSWQQSGVQVAGSLTTGMIMNVLMSSAHIDDNHRSLIAEGAALGGVHVSLSANENHMPVFLGIQGKSFFYLNFGEWMWCNFWVQRCVLWFVGAI